LFSWTLKRSRGDVASEEMASARFATQELIYECKLGGTMAEIAMWVAFGVIVRRRNALKKCAQEMHCKKCKKCAQA
jgi:hypothetical protein